MTTTPAGESFSTVLSRAIGRRRLTLERLSLRLKALGTPVSIATLSYWQSGRSVPTRSRSLQAVGHLERILSLPPGYLLNALPGDDADRWDPLAVIPPDERIYTVLEAMGMDLNRHATILTVQDSLRISADGDTHRQSTRQLVRATDDNVVHTPLVFTCHDAFNPPGITAGTGCHIGTIEVLEDISTVVAEIRLPHPLMRGDLAMFEYHVLRENQSSAHATYERQLPSSSPYLVLDVAFEGGAPLAIEYFHCERADLPRSRGQHRGLPSGDHVQVALRDAPPGLHGVRWTDDPQVAAGIAPTSPVRVAPEPGPTT